MLSHRSDTRSYVPPVAIGEIMRGFTVSRVLASKNASVKAGDLVTAATGWQEVAIVAPPNFEVVNVPAGASPADAIGVLGLTGLTAYFGLSKIGQPGPGDTVVVSGAAGATGSVAGQIAKLRGAKRVVGIAGSEDKCRWLTEELGFDAAVNYKSATFAKDLAAATPEYVNVYWDNVGGPVLEAVLTRAAPHARFVMCGAISGYNNPGKGAPGPGIRNLSAVTAQRIRMEGFIVFDYADEYAPAREEIARWVAEGKLKHKKTIVPGGLAAADSAILKLFDGSNFGKLLVEVKPFEVGGSSRL